MTLGPTSAWFLASRQADRKLEVLLTMIPLILAENCYLYFDSFTVCLQNSLIVKDLSENGDQITKKLAIDYNRQHRVWGLAALSRAAGLNRIV